MTIIQRRRRMHRVFLAVVILGIGGFFLAYFSAARPGPGLNMLAGAFAIGLITAILVREIGAGRRLAALVNCDWSRCLYCFFDLRGLTHRGACPECGERYEIERVRRAWRRALRPETIGKAERMAEAD